MEIVKKKSELPFYDLMEGCDRWEINVDGQHGLCALVDIMPRMMPVGTPCHPDTAGAVADYGAGHEPDPTEPIYYVPRKLTADGAIVQAARTSTGQGLKSEKEDRGLERFLYRKQHSTPFEMVIFKFHHVLPIFVARQLIRHRTASVNEFSLRYAEVKDRFWFPDADAVRTQSALNKQHTEGGLDLATAGEFLGRLHTATDEQMQDYRDALKLGVGRELARVGLPVNLYTEWYWSIDLRNLLHFLGLRQDKHAQAEIRVYADAMYELIKPLVPTAIEAYDDYHPHRGGLLLSRQDLAVFGVALDEGDVHSLKLKQAFDTYFPSDMELSDFGDKMERLSNWGITVLVRAHIDERKAAKAKK